MSRLCATGLTGLAPAASSSALLEQVARRHLPGGGAGHQEVQVLPGHAYEGGVRAAAVLREGQGGDVHALSLSHLTASQRPGDLLCSTEGCGESC